MSCTCETVSTPERAIELYGYGSLMVTTPLPFVAVMPSCPEHGRAPTIPCSAPLHDDTPPTERGNEWWRNHLNLAELYEHLEESCSLDPAEVRYFLAKPWKWNSEWEEMRAAKDGAR
jgi:hypothetical protein